MIYLLFLLFSQNDSRRLKRINNMKNLIILGAGGMGREIYDLAKVCSGYNTEYIIKGFLDDNKDVLKKFQSYPPVIKTIEEYIPQSDDVFVCSMGNLNNKKKSIQKILDKGGEFITLIHPSASISPNAKIGKGSILLKNVHVGANSVVGDYTLIQISAVVAHDVKIGNYSRLDCFTVCVGGAEIGDEVTVHTAAVINENVILGDKSTIGACSFVIRKVKENTTVFGNPAKRLI